MEFEIILLEQAVEFINSLDVKFRAKTYRTIELLGDFGFFLKEPHSKKLSGYDNLYELRVKLGSNICRLFYFHHHNRIFVITSGYIKREQKTNIREIESALHIMKSYLGN